MRTKYTNRFFKLAQEKRSALGRAFYCIVPRNRLYKTESAVSNIVGTLIEIYHFQGSRGGPTFYRGGPTFSRGGGGRGVQLLISYRNSYNL